jgi:hypothetical protein
MQKFSSCAPVVSLFLLSSLAPAQKSGVQTRHPISVQSGFFAALNSAPKATSYNKLSASVNAATQAQDPRIVSLPNFSSSFTFQGTTYPCTMVGQPPAENRTTVFRTTYVPMSFFFDEFVDQNGNNIQIDATTITSEVKTSPLFEPSSFDDGDTQFEDARMRAEFWPLINPGGNYHNLLTTPATLIPVVIEVPVGSSVVFVDNDGKFFALLDINFLSSQLNTLFQTEPISVKSIPIFLTRNAVYATS